MKRFSTKGNFPRPGITWGSEGLEEIECPPKLLPLSVVGAVTGNTYKFSAARPVREVDVRDVPSVTAAGAALRPARASKKEPKQAQTEE